MGRKHKYVPKQTSKKQEEYHEPDPPEIIVSEALHFQELMSRSRENINTKEDRCYLLSTKWLTSWKDYSGYELLLKGEDPVKHKNFRKKRPGKLNTDLLDHSDKQYYQVPQELPEYEFLNVVFDGDLQKDKDYVTVDSAVFTFLHEKYGGNVIQRPLRHVKNSNAYVDAELHYCSVCFVGPNQVASLRKATEQELKKKLDDFVPMKRLQFSTLWKLKQLKQFISQYVQVTYGVDRSASQTAVWKIENYLSLKETKQEVATAFRTESYYLSARQLTEEEYGSYDMDDYLKTSAALFIDVTGVGFDGFKMPEKLDGYCEECLECRALDFRCPCDKVYYCSKKCLYNDKQYHYKTCGSAYDSDDDEQFLKCKVDSNSGNKCGLVNLGNTCYMNATLQCLANIPRLAEYFCTNEYLGHLDAKEVEENDAIFIKKFAKFVKKLHSGKTGPMLEPWSLKMQISYFIKIFKGYDQHDANDLTVYLLNTLNEFVRKPEGSNYGQFLVDTFLGEFNSHVSCPECQRISTTKDPFLEVSVPLKTKVAVKDISYCIVQKWNHYIKGVCEVDEGTTWESVFAVIGHADDSTLMKMIGTLREIETETPFEYHKKFKKDTLMLFPQGNSKHGFDIPVTMFTLRVLAGNETKSAFGHQLYVRVPGADFPGKLYAHLFELFEVDEQTRAKLDNFRQTYQKEFDELLLSFEAKTEEETNEVEPAETKPTKLTKKEEEEQLKARQKLIGEFETTKNLVFQETFDSVLKFKVYIRTYRKSKRNCEYCGKKCSGCRLPYLISGTVKDFIQKSDEFKLEVVFDTNQPLLEENRTPPFCQYTTLEECLEEFSLPQQLDEQNAWYCDLCDNMRLANKQLSIEAYPKVLMLQLKRFKQVNGKKVKNNEVIQYPEVLEVPEGKRYRLNGVVVHEGSLQGGHYWAICEKNGKYYCFNDEHVKEAEYFHRGAYLLFYTMML